MNLFSKTTYWKKFQILYIALTDKRTPPIIKVITVVLSIAYFLMPIDFIPDFIPILWVFDDILMIPLIIWFLSRWIPKKIRDDAKKIVEKR